MQDRHVVTCFLAHCGRIALFKRSERVSTYQGRWAGISGSVDEGRTRLQQAVVEIREESGRTDARLMVTGSPVVVVSTDHETRFIVHPFLFHLPSEDLRLNWEHTEARFVRVDELASFETVPSLRAALDAVASPARLAQAVEEAGDRIRSDRTRGAGDLAADALDALALVRLSRAMHGAGTASWREAAARLAVLRPGIEAVRTAVARGALDAATLDDGDASEELFAARDRILSARASASHAAAGWLEARGLRRILTLSRSAAVAAAIEAMDPDVEIAILESLPLGEGVVMARDLAAAGRAVQVVPDAAVFTVSSGCSAALIGADGILANGDVVNKVGSAMVAAACKACRIPLLVVAEGFKAAPIDNAQGLEEAEWDPGDTGRAARWAPLFERVPAALVDGIASERGVAPPAAIADAAGRLRDALSAADLWTLFYGTELN